jgi:MFS family permease
LTAVLFAVSKADTWGWGASSTLGLFVAGTGLLAAWVASERRSSSPLVDMGVMAIRGVWTTNLLAVAIGASMFIAFILIPQFAQAPSSGGYGFDASVTGAGAFLVPLSLVMLVVGAYAGRIEARFGSKASATAGTIFILFAFVLLLSAHQHIWSVLLASAALGLGVGLAFAAMANLIVEAVPASQTGVASGINAVARTVGSAFGGQVAATFLAASVVSGRPGVDGFNKAFLMAIVAVGLGLVAIAAHPGRARPGVAREAGERVAVSA